MADETPKTPTYRYEDLPSLPETFADSIGRWYFDGNTLRIEFLVSRLDEGKPLESPSGRKLPACRLVLTSAAAIELLNRSQQLAAALEKSGLIKIQPGAQPAAQEAPKKSK